MRSRWAEAVEAYRRGVGDYRIGEGTFEAAGVMLLAGDEAAYRQFCGMMAAQIGQQADPTALHCLARAVTFGPSGIAPERAIAWAERAVAHEENASYLHALAMAHYRAGNFAETVRFCEKSSGHRWTGQLLNRLLSAMAHHQLGKSPVTRLLLRVAERMALDWMPLEAGGLARCEGPADWLEFQILRREAAELLGGDCPSEKPGRRAASDDELAPGNPPCEK